MLVVKNLPACQCRRHKRTGSILGGEGPLEESMAMHSSICLENPMDRARLQCMGLQRVGDN